MPVIFGGRYRLDALIGGGGMGEVWKAQDDVLKRTVAVKIIRPHLADDESIRARLQVEARLAGSLNHPGIVDVFDYGEDEDGGRTVPYLVMPFVDGTPLSQVLRERQVLPVGETMAIVAEVADALQAAHTAGIVHRDLKPANILLTTSGRVMLVDFGIARSIGGESLTQSGALIGTADYLSPEQSSGKSATDVSDLYALGVVAYACLTGAPPFHRDTDVATALAHIQAPVPELPFESEDSGASALIRSLLAKDPADRPQSAAEVALAARGFATQLPDSSGAEAPVVAVPLDATSPNLQPTMPGGTATAPELAPTSPDIEQTVHDVAATAALPMVAVSRDRRRQRRVAMLSSALVLIAIVAFLFANGGKQVTVPDVRDLTTTQATARLKAAGLKIKISKVNVAHHRAGDIVGQSPSAGDKIDKGGTVRVTVATGLIAIPSSLVGMTYDHAAAGLVKLGLMPARVDTSSSKAAGTVLSASPHRTAKPGDTVTLTVAAGSLTSNSPDKPGKGKHKDKSKGKAKPSTPKPKAPGPTTTTTTPSPDPSTSAPAG